MAHAVAGFSLAEGDLIRRAMTKDRGVGAMDGIRSEFVGRAVGRGVPKEKAEEVFGWIEGFSAYGFPKAHAASFAELAYASAWTRTHHPADFFCGVLNSQPMGFYSPRLLLNEARRVGLGILPPDVHLSGKGFTVEEDGSSVRVGLSYCKGLSEKAISSVIREREKPFSSVADLYRRTSVERDSLENLTKGGFLDALAPTSGRPKVLSEAKRLPKKRRRNGQPEIPTEHPADWWQEREEKNPTHVPLAESQTERMEWEVLGLNLRRHPLNPYRTALDSLGVTPSREIRRLRHGTRARAAGLMECFQCPPTKSGRPVWFLLIEDEFGLLQATIFRPVYEQYGDLLHHKGAFLLEGWVEQDRRRGFSFLVERVADLGKVLNRRSVPSPGTGTDSDVPLTTKRVGRRAG